MMQTNRTSEQDLQKLGKCSTHDLALYYFCDTTGCQGEYYYCQECMEDPDTKHSHRALSRIQVCQRLYEQFSKVFSGIEELH